MQKQLFRRYLWITWSRYSSVISKSLCLCNTNDKTCCMVTLRTLAEPKQYQTKDESLCFTKASSSWSFFTSHKLLKPQQSEPKKSIAVIMERSIKLDCFAMQLLIRYSHNSLVFAITFFKARLNFEEGKTAHSCFLSMCFIYARHWNQSGP